MYCTKGSSYSTKIRVWNLDWLCHLGHEVHIWWIIISAKKMKKKEEEEKVPYIWYTNIPKKVINLVLQRFFFLLIGKLHTSLMNFELIFNLTHFYLILTWEINHTAQGYHYHQHHSFTHGVVVQWDYKGKRKGCWGSGNESFFYS